MMLYVTILFLLIVFEFSLIAKLIYSEVTTKQLTNIFSIRPSKGRYIINQRISKIEKKEIKALRLQICDLPNELKIKRVNLYFISNLKRLLIALPPQHTYKIKTHDSVKEILERYVAKNKLQIISTKKLKARNLRELKSFLGFKTYRQIKTSPLLKEHIIKKTFYYITFKKL